ncbi:hypothetical protein IT157_02890 [bacterium]|nr:hypothetical protein [bacterium]
MRKVITLTAALALMLFSACSEISSPVSSTSEDVVVESSSYPAFDDLEVALPAGTEMIAMFEEAALDGNGNGNGNGGGGGRGCGPVSFSQFVMASQGATLNNGRGVRVTIGANVMPFDATISITNPQSCYAIYDFYPHPFQFNSNVEVKWYLSQFILPEGITWDDLQCWYLNDSGQFEEVSWEFSQNGQFLYLWTNHFSRYIITRPAG